MTKQEARDVIKSNKGFISSIIMAIVAAIGSLMAWWNAANMKDVELEQKFQRHEEKFIYMEKDNASIRKQIDRIDRRTEEMYRIMIDRRK